jgi:hypothetical protein
MTQAARNFSFSLPPLRGKVARGISRVTDWGPSPHDRSHPQFRPVSRRIRDSKLGIRECLGIRTSGRVSHHAQSAHQLSDSLHQARPPIALSRKRNRHNKVQAAPGDEIVSPQAACTVASTTTGARLSSCCGVVRVRAPSTSRAPIRHAAGAARHLPPRGGKAKDVANSLRLSLLVLSQLIAPARSGDREIQGAGSFLSLPPLRGKVARGVSRATDWGPS